VVEGSAVVFVADPGGVLFALCYVYVLGHETAGKGSPGLV
jgi:hypothetical protein